jgi:hypothetical protein
MNFTSMNKAVVVYFMHQELVSGRSNFPSTSSVVTPKYVTEIGFTDYIENATRFIDEHSAIESIKKRQDSKIYSTQTIYQNG